MASEFGTGKTIFVLAIVVGCFAVLWPKVFYPMLTASTVKPPAAVRPGSSLWKLTSNKEHLGKLCYILEEHHLHAAPFDAAVGDAPHRWASEADCFDVIKVSCGVVVTEAVLEGFRLGAAGNNLTECLTVVYGLSPSVVAAAAPPLVRPKLYSAQATGGARPERPGHLHPDMLHPALREKGRALPQRTIDKQARPGPMPGVRPPMGGGAGHISPSHQTKGTGSMSVIMPLYTVGIIIFFMYTIMKVLFKKGPEDDDKTPKLKDFHLDPEYRKYVFAEEYLDSGDAGQAREPYRRTDPREASGLRRRVQPEQADTKIEDEQMDQLRRRLEDTERAMERLMSQMGSVSDKLTAAKITEVLSQAQAQAKLLKLQEDFTSDEDDFTTSEALTATISDDESLFSTALRHRLLQQILLEKHPDFQSQLDQPIEKGIYRYDDSSNKHECFLQTRDQAAAATRNSPKAASVRRLSSEPEIRKAPSSTPSTGTNDKDSTPKAESQEPCLRKASSEVKSQGSASPNLNVDQKNTAMASTSFPSSMPAQKVSFRLPDSYVETPPNVSDLEDQSSDATETGADVSELRSFAEESAENQASAKDGNENDEIQKVVLDIVPELVMPSYKDILEEDQDNVPELVMPRYDDIPDVVQDNVPELAMPKYEDVLEEEKHTVPELVMPCYKDIPGVVRDDVPKLVLPKHENILEIEADNVQKSVMPSYKDVQEAVQQNVPELVMPRYEDNSDAMQDGISESGILSPEVVKESVHELIMPSNNDISEVSMPVGDTYAESQIQLPISETSEINKSGSAIDVPSGECTSELEMPVYESEKFSDSNVKPALEMSTFDDNSDLKVHSQDGPSEIKIKNKTTPAVKNTPSDSTPAFKIPVDEKPIHENVQGIDCADKQFSNKVNIAHLILPGEDINSCLSGFKKNDLESLQDLALLAQAPTSIVKQTDVTSNLPGEALEIRKTDADDNRPKDTLHFAPAEKDESKKTISDGKDTLEMNVPTFKNEMVEIVRSQQSEVDQLAEGSQSQSSVSDGTVQTSNIDVAQKLSSDNSNFPCDPIITMSDPTKSAQGDAFQNAALMDDPMFSSNLVSNKLYEAMDFSNQIGEVNGNTFDSRSVLKKEKEPHQTLIQLKLEKVDNDLFGKTSPQNLNECDSDSSDADQVAVGTQTSLAFDPPRMLKKKAAEISTQTEEDRALSVMGLNTSWCVDQHGAQSGPVVSTPKIRDITLDVMLPSETQALVTQARMGSYSSKDLEDDVSESGTPPCVITSQISLNIIGLEQNEDTVPSKSSLVFQSAAPTQSVCYGRPSTSGRNTNNSTVEPVESAQSGAIFKKTSTTDLPFNTISVYRHEDIIFPRPSPLETSSANVQEGMSSPLSREWHAAERDFTSSYPNSGIVLTNKTFPSDHSEDFEENRPRSPIPPSADESRYSSSNVSSGFFTDKQFGGPQFFLDTPDSLMEYSGWSTDATKPSTSEFMTRSSTDFSDYPDEYFYEFPDYNSSTVLSNDVDTSFVGSMSSLEDDLMEPMYFACSVSYTPSSSVPQTPDQETEIKLACDLELSALAAAAIEDDTTLYLPSGSPPTTPTEDRRPHSPQLNEASSLSSKRSSPDMEEYEVIQKDHAKSSSTGQAATAATPAPQV